MAPWAPHAGQSHGIQCPGQGLVPFDRLRTQGYWTCTCLLHLASRPPGGLRVISLQCIVGKGDIQPAGNGAAAVTGRAPPGAGCCSHADSTSWYIFEPLLCAVWGGGNGAAGVFTQCTRRAVSAQLRPGHGWGRVTAAGRDARLAAAGGRG